MDKDKLIKYLEWRMSEFSTGIDDIKNGLKEYNNELTPREQILTLGGGLVAIRDYILKDVINDDIEVKEKQNEENNINI